VSSEGSTYLFVWWWEYTFMEHCE